LSVKEIKGMRTLAKRLTAIVPVVGLGLTSFGQAAEPAKDDTAKIAFFEKKIRPILVEHCYTCHSAETKPAGDLRVDDRLGLLTGGNAGPSVVPGKPEQSLLLKRIVQTGNRRMPLEGKALSEEQVADLTVWIKDGAAWPALKVPASLGKPKAEYDALKKEHWAWQPLKQPKAPAVADKSWPKDSIDQFILAKLEAKKLHPVGDASKEVLIRRVTFDLTGLPPTTAEIDTFVKDTSKEAFAKVVDRLLASPQFGVRWGRHWLDVARYGESTGPSRNIPYPHAWKYRDYVINSVNNDIPYNRFIQEQIAGDFLAAKATNQQEKDRLLTATGFLALGVKDVNQRFKVRFDMDNVDEQIDAVSRSVLGLTVSCARCHDHKFDPIPTSDYYALAGIFTSTDNCAGVRNKMGGGGLDYFNPSMLVTLTSDLPPVPKEEIEKKKAERDQAKKEWDEIRGTPKGLARAANGQPTQRPFRLKYERLEAEFLSMTEPAARGHAVHGVRDAKKIADTEIRIRGEAEKLGPTVPRGFLSLYEVAGAAKVDANQSGRQQLADWLINPNNPLASRVIVNRVWQHLFDEGLVKTVDNFGVNGDTPSHPELLDHLSNRFIAEGWSIKKLVRAIVLTRAYQLDSAGTEELRQIDPANRLIWRHSPRRLDAEEIRDALLFVSGTLDLTPKVGSPSQELKMIEMRDNGPEAAQVNTQADKTVHRSIYLPLLRSVTPSTLEAFDPVEQTLVTGKRDNTTVPSQALYLLNSSFVRRQSLTFAEKLLGENKSNEERIQQAYRTAFGRQATEKELVRAQTFIAEYESAYRQIPTPELPVEKKPAPKARKKKDNIPDNPDDLEQTPEEITEETIRPKDPRTAAWFSFIQALLGSAEFRSL
jgi:mono/diheme cytochrome c family protein